MKLIKCYVSSFGKLKDFTFDFNSGLNTIKEYNGWGKSTFATFIKAMFYGLNDSKRSVSENERIKFRPWNSTQRFGGYVCFEWGGKEFRLERFFGNKESEDSVHLFDNVSGKEFSNTQDLGRRIFEIDEEGFLSTTYFSQKDVQIKSNTSITAKFNSVCEIQDTDAFDKALAKVEDKAKSYKYRGERGIIPDAKAELRQLEERIVAVKGSAKLIDGLKIEEKILNGKVSQLKQDIEDISERITKSAKAQSLKSSKELLQNLDAETVELEKTLQSAKEVLKNNDVSDGKIKYCNDKLTKLVEYDANIDLLKSNIEEIEKNCSIKSDKKISMIDVSLYVATLITFIGFIVSLAISGFSTVSIVLCILFGITALCSIGDLIYRLKLKNTSSGKFNDILTANRDRLLEVERKKQEVILEIDGYLGGFGLDCTDRTTALLQIVKIKDIYKDVCEKLAKNYEQRNKLLDNLKDCPSDLIIEDTNVLNSKLKIARDDYVSAVDAYQKKVNDIKEYESRANVLPELESRKDELVENIKRYEEEQNVLSLTAKFLRTADENLKLRYKAPLQQSLKKYFEYVSGVDKLIDIDVDMKVTVDESGEKKVTEYYSKGYQNLFEICKRFALVDVLFTGEKPFIILDDPFFNLDDEKLSSALELIKKLANDYQILYLVCHESRRA